jgi:hypothetical protein
VRHIFRRYVALGSVRRLKQELEAQGIIGKRWTSAAGRAWGGKPLSRGALYTMLRNRVYRGEIVHKGQNYPGEHEAIIDDLALWEFAQARLAENAVERRGGTRIDNPSLLIGLLFDSRGQRMTPTHAVKNGKRYRYYVSRPLIADGKTKAQAGLRIPAAEIEQIVSSRICRLFAEPSTLHEIIARQVPDAATQQRLIARAGEFVRGWPMLSPLRVRSILLSLVQRIEVRSDGVEISLLPSRLTAVLDDRPSGPLAPATEMAGDTSTIMISVAAELCRAGQGVRMIIDPSDPSAPPPKPDPSLVKAIVKAHRFNDRLRRQICRSGQQRKTAPLLLQPNSPACLPRPRHHRRHPRRTTAAECHRDDADRAPQSAAELARAAIRTRLCLSRHREPESPTAARSRPFAVVAAEGPAVPWGRLACHRAPRSANCRRCAIEFRQCINGQQRKLCGIRGSRADRAFSAGRAPRANPSMDWWLGNTGNIL